MIRMLVIFVFAGLSLAARSAAQTITFDPSQHLPEYDLSTFSEFGSLFQLEPFEKQSGVKISVAQLQELQSGWKAERARVQAEIDRLHANPGAMARFRFERAVALDGAYGALKLTRLFEDGPVSIHGSTLDEAAKTLWTPERAEKSRDLVRAVCERLPALLETLLGSAPPPAPFIPVVLVTQSQYQKLWQARPLHQFATFLGSYDPTMKAVVCELERLNLPLSQSAVLYSTTMFLLEHWSKRPIAPGSGWVYEGLAGLMAEHTFGADGKVAVGSLRRPSLERLISTAADEASRQAFLFSAADLMKTSCAEVMDRAASLPRPAAFKDARTFAGEAGIRYQLQLALLVDFFLSTNDPDVRALLAGPLSQRLETEKAAANATLTIVASDLQSRFVEHLKRRLSEQLPGTTVRDEWFEVGERFKADPAAAAAEPPFQPSELAAFGETPRTLLAGIVDTAACGDLRSAIQRLIGVLEGESLDEAARARAQRELYRLEALEQARRAALAACAGDKNKIRVEIEGKAHAGTVSRVEDERLYLQLTSGGETDLSLSAVDSAQMMKLVSDKKVAIEDPATVAYLSLLAATGHHKKLLEGRAEPLAALRADAGEYAELRKEGEAIRRLQGLSQRVLPDDSEGAASLLEEIKALWTQFAGTECVTDRRSGLRGFARAILARQFDDDPVGRMRLHGRPESLEGDRLRLHYEFDDAKEIEDFSLENEYLAEFRATLSPLHTRPEQVEITVSRGMLTGVGGACLVHRLPLKTPLTVSLEMYWQSASSAAEDWQIGMDVILCDDGHGSRLTYDCGVGLTAMDKKSGHTDSSQKMCSWLLDTAYSFKIVHDGTGVEALMDGQPHSKILAGPLVGGRVLLWLHSDFYACLKRLVIEGCVDPAGLTEPRNQWVSARLKEILPES